MEKQLPITLLIVGLVVGMAVGYFVAPNEGGGILPSGEDNTRIAELEGQLETLEGRLNEAKAQFPTDIYAVTGY